jgi:cold shock CspA family protein
MQGVETGVITKNSGGFGFIKPDDANSSEMFVMPAGCVGFGSNIPPLGTQVRYEVVTDAKTGRPRAENVVPPSGFDPAPAAWEPMPPQQDLLLSSGRLTGTVLKNNGKFGFIQQDNGEPDMFVMPIACKAWGEEVPGEGTRVFYDVVQDVKTGRPRAESVEPMEDSSKQGLAPSFGPVDPHLGYTHHGYGAAHPGYQGYGGGYGAYQPAPAYGRSQPYGHGPAYPAGVDLRQAHMPAPVMYGSPAVGNRAFAQPMVNMPVYGGSGGLRESGWNQAGTGTMATINGKFGFIKLDSGGPDMFVMPAACRAFGDALPAPGTRLQFQVVKDQKTGRPRAEEVSPLP